MNRRFSDATLHLPDGTDVVVRKLTRELAREFQSSIVRIHNTIPFQNWSGDELLAEDFEGRIFHSKWALSHIAFLGSEVVAVNIAYERPAEGNPYLDDSIYMHRFAVAPTVRRRWLGRLFHAHAMDLAFTYVPLVVTRPINVLYGQTQATLENAHVLRFYTEGCGFVPVGFKYYSEKVDVVLRVERERFYNSNHWQALQGRREISRK